MRIVAADPPFPRTRHPLSGKIRGAMLAPPGGYGNGKGWKEFWDTMYDFDGWIKPQIVAAANMGANAIKLIPHIHYYTDGGANQRLISDRIERTMDLALSRNMMVALMVPSQDWLTQTFAPTWDNRPYSAKIVGIQRFVQDMMQYPNILYFDAINEINYHMDVVNNNANGNGFGGGVPATSRVFSDIREVSKRTLPLTASINVTTFNDSVAQTWVPALLPYLDLIDFHIYSGGINAAHLDDWQKAPYSKLPIVIGEYGSFGQGSPGAPVYPTVQYTADIVTSIRATHERECVHGTFFFPITSYDNADPDYGGDGYRGLVEANFTENTAIINAFKNLVTRPLPNKGRNGV